jgi:pimeloyl-ACP methyl ester carboxylesterase
MPRSVLFLFALAVSLAACGSGDDESKLVGTDISISVQLAPNSPQTIALSGIERGSGPVGVVLAHMLNSSQSAWQGLVEKLVSKDFHVLTFDFRGHGISGGDRDPSAAALDLAAAVAKLRSLGASTIVVVGASMGGTAAMVVAAQEKLAGVVVISAPLSIDKLDASGAARQLAEPSLFIVGEKDNERYTKAVRDFAAAAPQPTKLEVIAGSGAHGTDLLEDSKTRARVTTLIVDFLTAHRG